MTEPVITAQTLRHFLICERRIWLDRNGDHTLRDALTQGQFINGTTHEQMISATMFGPAETVPAASWQGMVQSTGTLMEQGVAAIRGAAFERTISLSEPLIVRGRADWVRRTMQPSRLGKWSYEPVEIKLRQECNEADRLQLDLYVWLLQGVQNVEPSGWFWMGRDADNYPIDVVEHYYDQDRLFAAFEQVDAILKSASAPAIFLASHCAACHWNTSCKQIGTAGRDLAALPGLTRQTWEQMQREGIRTLDHVLALTPKDLERFKGLGKSKAQEIYAYAQAIGNGQPVQRNPMPEAARQPGIMLDLETCMDGNIGVPWCFGWQGVDEQFQVAIVDAYYDAISMRLPNGVTARIVSDSDAGWRLFAQAAREHPGPIYHWGSFEKGVLRATAPAEVVEALESRLHDLNKTFKRTFAFPVRGTSIKTVAPYLGFGWPEGTNAFSSWVDYRAWLLDYDRNALSRACDYNRADVEAMSLVWHWMLNNDGRLFNGE